MKLRKQNIYKYLFYLFPITLQRIIRKCYNQYLLYLSSLYDLRNFQKYSGLNKVNSKNTLEARIIKNYHKIEKGLTFKQPHPKFGKKVITNIKNDLYIYSKRYGVDKTIISAISTFEEYIEFNNDLGFQCIKLNRWIELFKREFKLENSLYDIGGTITIKKEKIFNNAKIDLKEFFNSRHSIRNFDKNLKIDMNQIETAVSMAQKTPSVCNRQAARVYVVSKKTKQNEILKLQNGNRGFGSQIDKLILIGVDLNYFLTSGERNQGWIDGGLFAMSLIYALHSLGLATCCLNWSVDSIVDKKLKEVTGISKNISIIMFLAVGNLPKEIKVAKSNRKELTDILQII